MKMKGPVEARTRIVLVVSIVLQDGFFTQDSVYTTTRESYSCYKHCTCVYAAPCMCVKHDRIREVLCVFVNIFSYL